MYFWTLLSLAVVVLKADDIKLPDKESMSQRAYFRELLTTIWLDDDSKVMSKLIFYTKVTRIGLEPDILQKKFQAVSSKDLRSFIKHRGMDFIQQLPSSQFFDWRKVSIPYFSVAIESDFVSILKLQLDFENIADVRCNFPRKVTGGVLSIFKDHIGSLKHFPVSELWFAPSNYPENEINLIFQNHYNLMKNEGNDACVSTIEYLRVLYITQQRYYKSTMALYSPVKYTTSKSF